MRETSRKTTIRPSEAGFELNDAQIRYKIPHKEFFFAHTPTGTMLYAYWKDNCLTVTKLKSHA